MKTIATLLLSSGLLAVSVNGDCSSISNTIRRTQCEALDRLAPALDQANWSVCSTETGVDPCVGSSCWSENGISRCNAKKQLLELKFTDANIGVKVIDPAAVATELQILADNSMRQFKIQDHASLGLTSCFDACESALECDFTGSECTGDCSENGNTCPEGSIATPAPTDEVVATPAPTDEVVATPAPTDADTDAPSTSPSAAPSAGPTPEPTNAPTEDGETLSPSTSPSASPSAPPSTAPSASPTPLVTEDPQTEEGGKNSTNSTASTLSPTSAPTVSAGSSVEVVLVTALCSLFFMF